LKQFEKILRKRKKISTIDLLKRLDSFSNLPKYIYIFINPDQLETGLEYQQHIEEQLCIFFSCEHFLAPIWQSTTNIDQKDFRKNCQRFSELLHSLPGSPAGYRQVVPGEGRHHLHDHDSL
jgi:hypothetical protein